MLMAALVILAPVEDSAAVDVLIEQVAPDRPGPHKGQGAYINLLSHPCPSGATGAEGAWFGSRPSRPDG